MIPPSDPAAGSASGNPPPDRTLRCRMVVAGAAKPQVHFRAMPPVQVHEALGLSETSAGTVPSELLLATLGNCLIDRIRANAAMGNIIIDKLVLEIEADLPVCPLWGSPGIEPEPVGFEAINVSVHMDAAAPEAALRALINHAVIWSPVANTLHGPVHLNVALASAPVS